MTHLIGLTGQAGAGKDAVAGFLRELGWASIAFSDPLKVWVRDAWNLPEEVLWGESRLRESELWSCSACGDSYHVEPSHRRDRACQRCAAPGGSPIVLWTCLTCGQDGPPSEVDVGDHEALVLCRVCGSSEPCVPQPLTPRLALQRLGTEWGRALDVDVWVRWGIRRAKALQGAIHPGVGAGPLRAHRDDEGTFWPSLTACDDHGRIAGVALTDARFANEMVAIRTAGGVIWRVYRRGAGLSGAAARHQSEMEQGGLPVDTTLDNSTTLDDLRDRVHEALHALVNP